MARRSKLWRFVRFAALALALVAAGFTLYLDFRVRSEFEGRRFALPARIYARPLELHAGQRVSQADVIDELRHLGYREAPPEGDAGWYSKNQDSLEIALRPFTFWDGRQPAKPCDPRLHHRSTSMRPAAGNAGQRPVGTLYQSDDAAESGPAGRSGRKTL